MTEPMTSNIILLEPELAIQRTKMLSNLVTKLHKEVLQEGVDYGVIPGTKKPSLLKPGMEKLLHTLRLRPRFDAVSITEDFEKPLFHYRYKCVLVEIETGYEIAESNGSCNSRESKYAWRWVSEHQIPEGLNKDDLEIRKSSVGEYDFAVEGGKTDGQYGKPESHWKKFKDAIEDGSATKTEKETKRGMATYWLINSTVYRIPNPDVYDQVNTIDKMAQKRALGSAILQAANVSEHFTVDIENLIMFAGADVIPGTAIEVSKEKPAPQPESFETLFPTADKPDDETPAKWAIGNLYAACQESLVYTDKNGKHNSHHMRGSIDKLIKDGQIKIGEGDVQGVVDFLVSRQEIKAESETIKPEENKDNIPF